MFTMSEIIVLLWLAPVTINILLPLTVLGFSIISKALKLVSIGADSREEKEYQRQVLSAARN